MFKLFQREASQSEVDVLETIEELHNAFDNVSDDLLTEANAILAESAK